MRPTLLIYYNLLTLLVSLVCSHLPDYVSTPSSIVEQYCGLAESCVHDTIPICGKMDDQKRTFLDICDLLEYACDTGRVYLHVDDMEGCPVKI